MKLSDPQKQTLLILRQYPTDIVMHDGWLTGGHGVKLNLKTVQSLKDKGLVGTGTNQRITELGKTIDLEAPATTDTATKEQAPEPSTPVLEGKELTGYENMPAWSTDNYTSYRNWAKACFDAGKQGGNKELRECLECLKMLSDAAKGSSITNWPQQKIAQEFLNK